MKLIKLMIQKYRWEIVLGLIAIATSIAGIYLFYSMDLLTANGDSIGKLNISRRFFDSYTPGFAQLGYVWLPINQLLMAVFVWNDFMWLTGLAGAVVSGVAFVFSAVAVYKLGVILGGKLAGYLAYLFYILNPNIFYLQSTPLTEIFFLSTLILAMYFVTLWFRHRKVMYLVLSGLAMFMCTLSRYEGWAIAGILLLVIFLEDLFRHRNFVKAEATAWLYSFIGFFGVFLWLVWNWVIFKNPIYFAVGEYSAREQQRGLLESGFLPTFHNLPASILYFLNAVWLNSGTILFILGILGFFYFLQRFIRKKRFHLLFPFVLAVPVFYFPFALLTGNIVIYIPEQFPYWMHNIRYGITLLPFLILLGAYLISRLRYLWVILAFLVLFEYRSIIVEDRVITMNESVHGFAGRQAYEEQMEEGMLFKEIYDGGYILADPFNNDPAIFYSEIHLNNWIGRGNLEKYEKALAHPEEEVRWIWVRSGDDIDLGLKHREELERFYEVVYSEGSLMIYRLREG
jgi:hypothetical protein